MYHDQVQRSLAESDLEAANAGDAEDNYKHGASLDTRVPKTLKGAMVINSDSDKLQELKIKNRDHMDISKFVTAVTHILRSTKAEFLAAESLGGFAEYQEAVGVVSGINTWDRNTYAYLNTHHGEKFYETVTTGAHKQIEIEFVKHARHGGSKDFDVLIMISGAVLAPCLQPAPERM